jgi:hypothetical protein
MADQPDHSEVQASMFGERGTLVKCSFCGKSNKQVTKLIAGPGVYICNECVGLCGDILAEEISDEERRAEKNDVRKALAQLSREMGASILGKQPMPDRDRLSNWLLLLGRVRGRPE